MPNTGTKCISEMYKGSSAYQPIPRQPMVPDFSYKRHLSELGFDVLYVEVGETPGNASIPRLRNANNI